MDGFCHVTEENTICEIELKALKEVCFGKMYVFTIKSRTKQMLFHL